MNALLNIKLGFTLIFACLCHTVAAQDTEPTVNLGNRQMTRQKSAKDADNDWLKTQLAEIEKSRREVEKYNPLVKGYLVGYSNRDYILLAVSPKAREKWLGNENAVNIQPSS